MPYDESDCDSWGNDSAGKAAEPALDLKALRLEVEAADPLRVKPAELLCVIDRVRCATLAAIAEAECSGTADETLRHLSRAWRTGGNRRAD